MAGVTVTLSGSMTGTIVTDIFGSYAFTNLPGGGNYTVTPSLAKFMFSPPSATFNNLSSNRVFNFTGRVATYTISGGVLIRNGSNIDGFTIELTGTRTGTAVTNFQGYSFSGLPVDGNYTVTAYLANRLFTNFKLLPPTSQSFTALSSNMTANFSARRLAFGTGNLDPLGIASGDLNGDGKQDVVVATTTGTNIHVLLGNGDGTLQPEVSYPADSNPVDVVIADFDGDGKADVASANFFGSNVSIFHWQRRWHIEESSEFSTLDLSHAILNVSDFNNDGKVDLATLGAGNTLSILLGNGNGTFQSSINRTVATGGCSVLPGDLNGDGKIDLVLLGFPGNVLVLVGRGDGTFDDPVSYPAANEIVKATLADLNSDGKLDVAVASRLPNAITILLGRGDGTFQTGIKTTTTMTPADIISHDFDGNGKRDLVVAGDSGGFGFLSGNGDGTFSPLVVYQSTSFSRRLVAADFNNDSRLDFAISQGNGEVSIVLTSVPTSPPPTIFVEEGTSKAAAVESVTRLRGPFSILNTHNFSADDHTRVMLFTSNLGLSQPDSAILSVRANGILLTVENVGTVSGVQGLGASYIIVRLPDGLPPGNLPLTVTLHGVVSTNTPTLEISP